MPRSFDGLNDEVRVSIGNSNITGAITMVAVLKRNDTTYNAIMGLHTSGGTATYSLEIADTTGSIDFTGKVDWSPGVVVTNADNWVLVAVTKAAGTSTPRAHKYVYGTDTWTHTNGSSTLADQASVAGGTVRFGEWQDVDDYEGLLAANAIWDSALTDAQIESLAHSLNQWVALAPVDMWVWDHLSSGSAITSWTGSGASTSGTGGNAVGTTISTAQPPLGYGAPVIQVTTTAPPSGATGDAAATFPGLTASASGTQTHSGTAAATFPSLTAAGTGTGPITISNLAADHDVTNRLSTDYTTASISWIEGRTYLVAVRARTAVSTPELTSITGGGNTFDTSLSVSAANVSLFFGWVVAASTTAGAITINPGGAEQWTAASWIVDEVAGAHPTTPIVQESSASETGTHTSLPVTLSSFANATHNAVWSAAQINDPAVNLAREGGYTALGSVSNVTENTNQLITFWKIGEDTSVESTNDSSTADSLAVAVELSTLISATSGAAAATFPGLTASASGTQTQTGTGAATFPSLTASATGYMQPSGTAAATFPGLTASATGTQTYTGTAAATFPSLTASASGTQTHSGTGAATFPSATASGTGTVQPSGAGAATFPSLSAAATGTQTHSGTGAATFPSATASASGYMQPSGAGAATFPSATASATGTQTQTGTAAATFPALTAAASGTQTSETTGSGAATFPSVTASAAGTQTHSGTAAATFPSATAAATGTMLPDGDAAATFPALTASATGTQTYTGTATATFPSLGASASGTLTSETTGSGVATFPSLTASASGTQTHSGSGASTFPGLTASASGYLQPIGTAAATFPSFGGVVATGTQTQSGDGAATFPSPTASGTGTQTQTGAAVATFPGLAAVAAGTQTQTGTGAATLPSLTVSASGYLQPIGVGAAIFPYLVAVAAGTKTSGSAADVLISVTGSDAATMSVSGNEAGIVVDGTDTSSITITGGV